MKKILVLLGVFLILGVIIVIASRCSAPAPAAPRLVPTQTAVIVTVEKDVTREVTKIVEKQVTQVVEKQVTQIVVQTVAPLPTYTPYPTWTVIPSTPTVTKTPTPTPDVVATAVQATMVAMGIKPSAPVSVTPIVVGPVATVLVTGTVPMTSTKAVTAVLPKGTIAPLATKSATPSVSVSIKGGFKLDWGAVPWYWSPIVPTESHPNLATQETFAEPGVLLDETAAYDHMSAADTAMLVPEGGYAYVAIGGVTFRYEDAVLVLPAEANNIFLIILRGLPDDGTEVDLNRVVMAEKYVRSAGLYSPMPAGAYVSLGWFAQQVSGAYQSPNCGLGCKHATIVVVDLETRTYRKWHHSNPKDPLDWEWNQP